MASTNKNYSSIRLQKTTFNDVDQLWPLWKVYTFAGSILQYAPISRDDNAEVLKEILRLYLIYGSGCMAIDTTCNKVVGFELYASYEGSIERAKKERDLIKSKCSPEDYQFTLDYKEYFDFPETKLLEEVGLSLDTLRTKTCVVEHGCVLPEYRGRSLLHMIEVEVIASLIARGYQYGHSWSAQPFVVKMLNESMIGRASKIIHEIPIQGFKQLDRLPKNIHCKRIHYWWNLASMLSALNLWRRNAKM